LLSPGTAAVLAASHPGQPQGSVDQNLAAAPGSAMGPQVLPDSTSGTERTVRFYVNGGGPAPDGFPLVPGETAPHSATGTATHLGAYTGSGTFQLGSLQISATGHVTATFQGTFVFVAANGDQLACNYGAGYSGVFTGQLSADGTTLLNGRFVATFTPDPTHSTGRFANVVGGGFEMIALAPPVSLISTMPGYSAPFNYNWNGDGALEFQLPGSSAVLAAPHPGQQQMPVNQNLTAVPGSTAGVFRSGGNANHLSDSRELARPENDFATHTGHHVHAVGPQDGASGNDRTASWSKWLSSRSRARAWHAPGWLQIGVDEQ
jgi:hypothetical protein